MKILRILSLLVLPLILCASPSSAQTRTFVNFAGTYSSATSYNLGDMVISGGTTYISIVSDNQGYDPSSNPSEWTALLSGNITQVTPGGSPYSIQYSYNNAFTGASINGILFASTNQPPRAATAVDIGGLFGSASCGYLRTDGTCGTPNPGVTNLATGSWPSWLTPSIVNSSTTPSLSVTSSAIPNNALAAISFSFLQGAASVAQLPLLHASGSAHTAGIVPDPGATAGSTRFLREDAVWAVPAGSGGSEVSSFSTGSWPTWLTPTVTNAATTPTLSVSVATIPNSALNTTGGGPVIPTQANTSTTTDDIVTISNSSGAHKDSGFKLLTSVIPPTGTAFMSVDSLGNIFSTSGITAACAGASCPTQQINFAPCSTVPNLSGSITSSQTTIPVTSVSCLSPQGVALITNNNAGEFITWSGISGNTLTGVTRAYYGTTGMSQTTSAQLIQVNQSYSTSSTNPPYFFVLQNGSINYDYATSSGYGLYPNTAVVSYFQKAGFLGGFSAGAYSTITTTATSPFNNPQLSIADSPSGCGTAHISYHADSNQWSVGSTSSACTVATNGVGPDVLGFTYRAFGSTTVIPGLTIQPLTYNFATIGSVTALSYSTQTNCVSSASPAVCGSAPTGSFVIAVGTTSIVVNTTAITAHSRITITPDASLGSELGVTCNTTPSQAMAPFMISARTPGTSFTLTINGSVATNPNCYTYNFTD